MNTKNIFLLFFLVIFSSFCYAAPSIYIQPTILNSYMYNTSNVLSFNVYNSTGYKLNISNTNCTVQLYNTTGNNIMSQYAIFNANYNYIDFNYSLNSKLGTYSYSIYCNSTQQEAGFVTGSFYVTETGMPPESPGILLYIAILFPLIFGLILLFSSWSLSPEHTALKISFLLFSLFTIFMSGNLMIITLIKFYNISALQDSFISSLFLIGIFIFAILCYFIIYMIAKGIHIAAQKKNEKMEY